MQQLTNSQLIVITVGLFSQNFKHIFSYSGLNDPDVVREVTAVGKDAQKVSEAVKKAPSAVKKQSEFMCPGSCTLL